MVSTHPSFKHLLEIIPGKVYILRGDLIASFINLGTHMMFFKLHNDKYMIVDTVDIDIKSRKGSQIKGEIDLLTNSGQNIECVLAAHSYHTLFFPQFYNLYKEVNPSIKYYGTPRHKRISDLEVIPWETETIIDLANSEKFKESDGLDISIPKGDDFASPSNDNHVLGAFLYHQQSKTLYIDDTLVVVNNQMAKGIIYRIAIFFNLLKTGRIWFHPKTLSLANFPAFRSWMQDYCSERKICNLLTAHVGNKTEENGLNDEILRSLDRLNEKYLENVAAQNETKSKI